MTNVTPLIASIAPYGAIGTVILIVAGVSVVMLILAHTIGPKRHGPVKDSVYESGVLPIADTNRRFNVRFYVVAMLFLLFDVDVVFMWPWAQVFHASATAGAVVPLDNGMVAGKGFLAIGMGLFAAILLFGLAYEWKKGAFKWD